MERAGERVAVDINSVRTCLRRIFSILHLALIFGRRHIFLGFFSRQGSRSLGWATSIPWAICRIQRTDYRRAALSATDRFPPMACSAHAIIAEEEKQFNPHVY